MNIDGLIAELLAQPLDQFTPRRNTRVNQLKAAGQAELARGLSAVKKPSVSLWAANRVDKGRLGGLRRAAQAVSKAQAAAATGRSNAASELRGASESFQRELEDAVGAAGTALRQGGHAGGEETLRRIREIFRLAALGGGEVWDQLQNGALAAEPRAGDDMLEMFAAGAKTVGGKRGERVEARRAAEQAQRAARADLELAERASATAQRLRHEATEAAAAARRAADRAAAAEAEADQAQAQAQKSQRAAGRRLVD